MEIAQNVHLVPGVIANTYVIIDSSGLALIDAGLPNRSRKIMDYIHSIGRQPSAINQIIITHADFDHIGSLEALRAATSAQVAASRHEADSIQTGKPSRELSGSALFRLLIAVITTFMKPVPSKVDRILAGGEELSLLGGLQVIPTPGHTPGHISLWSPSTRILFSGDSILVRLDSFAPSQGRNNWDEKKSEQSFWLQSDLHPAMVCGGHGWTDQNVDQKFSGYSTAYS